MHATSGRKFGLVLATLVLAVGCSGEDTVSDTTPATSPATAATTAVPVTSTVPSTEATTEPTVPEPLPVGETELTERQQQLLAVVEEYFDATSAYTIGSGPPDAAEVDAVVDLFEPYGRVIWFNGVVYRVSDDDFRDMVQYGVLPWVDPSDVVTHQGPGGSVTSANQFAVLEDQVVWMGHIGGDLRPAVMVFSFHRGSDRIGTLYVSRGDITLMDDIGLPWTPPSREECTVTPTIEEMADPTADEFLQKYGDDCLHYWIVVTSVLGGQYGPCHSMEGYYTDTPQLVSSGPAIRFAVGESNDPAQCVKSADVQVGDLVEVWGPPPVMGTVYDFEVVVPQ